MRQHSDSGRTLTAAFSVLALTLSGASCVVDLEASDQIARKVGGRPLPGKQDSSDLPKVYHGTTQPTHVQLSSKQIRAIGSMTGGGPGSIYCSATLIAPRWVLTANHCGVSTSDTFCVGSKSSTATCFDVARVVNHGSRDTSLLELEEDVTAELSDVEPIPFIGEAIGSSWVGRKAEGAGFGQTHTGSSGRRYFTAEPIISVSGDYVSVDGQGQRGLCYGDSGGPLLAYASDGSARVIGDLTGGDGSCVDVDNYTRIDLSRDWIEDTLGSSDPGNPGDPCEGLDYFGECQGEVARWCDDGELRTRDCGAEGKDCAWVNDQIGYYCE
jgi:hypothetical protein